ncbi:MAG: DUF2164 domain-containing protein [Gemmatimonadales bacterium]|nr:DUF2164 domain-containing protein [Gemmatimonadales bacterium]
MTPTLSDDDRKQAVVSLARFVDDELDVELGGIQVESLLMFFLKEIAPVVYNQGVADAQVFLRDRIADLEATCYAPEFTYWPKASSVRRK